MMKESINQDMIIIDLYAANRAPEFMNTCIILTQKKEYTDIFNTSSWRL